MNKQKMHQRKNFLAIDKYFLLRFSHSIVEKGVTKR